MSNIDPIIPDPQKTPIENPTENLFNAGKYLKRFLMDVLDLQKGVDKRAIISEIKNKKSMNGPNAWMLMCSIVIASIGLDMNSPAVIIGAMLISPLMSPILGIGLGVGINDRETLKKSLMHFGTAIAIAIVTSTIYFWLSPFDIATPEIEARTEPTFLDIFVALFGGVAGIISIARKDLSTTLPGVAIATALMPPVCVTGFGIANGDWQMATSSFYLFFLNSFFVSLATYLIVNYLRFPHKEYVDKKESRRNIQYVILFSLITIIPSILIFKNVWVKYKLKQNISLFIEDYIGDDEIYLDSHHYYPGDSINRLVFKVYGDKISKDNMAFYNKGLKKHNILNTKLQIISTADVKLDRLQKLEDDVDVVEKIASQLDVVEEEQKEKDRILELVRSELAEVSIDSTSFVKVCDELRAIYPGISSVNYSVSQGTDFDQYQKRIPILLLKWQEIESGTDEKEERIKEFIKTRMSIDTLILLRTNT